VAERSGGTIEPLPKLQWFVAVNKEFEINKSSIKGIEGNSKTTLKEIMRKSVANGQVTIMPEREEKKYFHWIDDLRDWNISRQLWYGHRIPVWYKDIDPQSLLTQTRLPQSDEERAQNTHVGIDPPEEGGWEQDPDTLDTWFSSALWTFSTLGWPDEDAPDLKKYHPTSFMNPGYEILFFWVARMILMSGFLLGEVPFKIAYIHGMLRDAKGQKFSKSLDNGVDPIDIINQYGADALRMAVLVGVGPGNDCNFDQNKVKGYKHFGNKLWNIARFVLMSLPDNASEVLKSPLTTEDQKLIDELNFSIKEITDDMDQYRFYLAAEKIYHYIWHTFADKIIEESKPKIANTEEKIRLSAQRMLLEILLTCLKILHPFMPFITEEIYSILPTNNKTLLMVENWPQ
jgi:valyl-tRNA synthetase